MGLRQRLPRDARSRPSAMIRATLVPALQNLLSGAIFSNGCACQTSLEGSAELRGSSAMGSDLQTKIEKYESKAAQCKDRARQAKEGPQRAFYDVLAGYYDELATDFRQIIEKKRVV